MAGWLAGWVLLGVLGESVVVDVMRGWWLLAVAVRWWWLLCSATHQSTPTACCLARAGLCRCRAGCGANLAIGNFG